MGSIEAVESIDTHESILGVPRTGIHVSEGAQPFERLGVTLTVAEGLGDEAAEFVESLNEVIGLFGFAGVQIDQLVGIRFQIVEFALIRSARSVD